jgi:hypothetical protein
LKSSFIFINEKKIKIIAKKYQYHLLNWRIDNEFLNSKLIMMFQMVNVPDDKIGS